jgi:uncharacterized protein (DUF362 family)
VSPRDKVVIKPNLVFALPPSAGFTTDPRVVGAIVELCRRVSPREIVIAEGSGGADTRVAFEACGYKEIARELGVDLVDLNDCSTQMVEVPRGRAFRELEIPQVIVESDALIDVPKLKVNKGRRWASLSVKNLIGALPGKGEYSETPSGEYPFELSPEFWAPDGEFFMPHHRRWWAPSGEKKRIHADLAEGLVDLNTVIRPSLNVIDGTTAHPNPDISGTKGEKAVILDTIMAARDPLALDLIAAEAGGVDPLGISYLKRAAVRGLGESDYRRIEVVGTPLEQVKRAWSALLQHDSGSEESPR